MKIGKHNIDEVLRLFHDGELSTVDELALFEFLEQHPEFIPEDNETLTIPNENISYDKNRKTALEYITEKSNFLLIEKFENTLESEAKKDFLQYWENQPSVQKHLEELRKTIQTSDRSIRFTRKKNILSKINPSYIQILFTNRNRTAIAACAIFLFLFFVIKNTYTPTIIQRNNTITQQQKDTKKVAYDKINKVKNETNSIASNRPTPSSTNKIPSRKNSLKQYNSTSTISNTNTVQPEEKGNEIATTIAPAYYEQETNEAPKTKAYSSVLPENFEQEIQNEIAQKNKNAHLLNKDFEDEIIAEIKKSNAEKTQENSLFLGLQDVRLVHNEKEIIGRKTWNTMHKIFK